MKTDAYTECRGAGHIAADDRPAEHARQAGFLCGGRWTGQLPLPDTVRDAPGRAMSEAVISSHTGDAHEFQLNLLIYRGFLISSQIELIAGRL